MLLVVLGCTSSGGMPDEGRVAQRMRAQPGERVRVVRFMVKPDMRFEFEEFFWRSLKPAAEGMARPGSDPTGSFRLLIPESPNRDELYTYYVIVDPIRGQLSSRETMRDMVRAAFPGEDGQRRIERWMSSIVLGDRAPASEEFIEADLRAERFPDP